METNDAEVIELSDEQYKAYCRLQNRVVIMDAIFCTLFVLCITLIVYTTGNWKLMWFYLLPLFTYVAA